MDKEYPAWLTLDFLNQCLHSKEKYRKSTATTFTAEFAIPPGNNYGSYILRVRLTVTAESHQKENAVSLIIKCPLEIEAYKERFDIIYLCESAFYNEFLPLGDKLLNRQFFPEYFHSPMPKVVVLEDLKDKGYLMADRTKQLDFDHCRLYMEAAANFHAMSFAVYKQDPGLIHRLGKEKIFSNDWDELSLTTDKNMVKYCLECVANRVSESMGDQRIEKVLRSCSSALWEMLIEAMKPNDTLNTITQGDPWTTNMMFKYSEDGNVCDIKLLDFQCLRYGSPVNDLVFFIWSSSNRDVLKNKQDMLYKIYVDRLNSNFEELNFKEMLTFETVKQEVKRLSPYILWLVALGSPMFLQPTRTDVESLSTKCQGVYSPDDNPYDVIFTESFCNEHLFELIQLMDSVGVFEYLENKLKNS